MTTDLYSAFSNYRELNSENRHRAANEAQTAWDADQDDYRAYREEWNRAAETDYTPEAPLHVDIELSDGCNLRCKMCKHGMGMPQSGGQMSLETARAIIQECAEIGVKAIKFNWRGEPTLNRNLPDCIRLAKTSGILEVSINTNGLPPKSNQNCLTDCCEAGIDRIIFSVDGFSKATYEAIRIGSHYEQVLANIQAVVDWKKQQAQPKPLLRIQMVRTTANAHEVPDFIRHWSTLMDDVRISDVMNRGQGNAMGMGDQITTGRRRCPQPFQRLTIGRDGRISPCCSDWDQTYVLGRYPDNRLLESWNCEKMQHLRQIQRNTEHSALSICRDCYVKESYIWESVTP